MNTDTQTGTQRRSSYSNQGQDPLNVVLEASQLCKNYGHGKHQLVVLAELSLSVAKHEMVAITGSSGSGKSTLLHILGSLDAPDKGVVRVKGTDIHGLPSRQLAAFRNSAFGFIYQFHHLLPEFTALENVAMPQIIQGTANRLALGNASDWLDRVGLSHKTSQFPAQLSGGERQRVAIARALINHPTLVFADEPTGNLDQDNSAIVFDLFKQLRTEYAMSCILVTHDQQLAAQADRRLQLVQGQLVSS